MLSHLHKFDSNCDLSEQLAERIAGDLGRAIGERGSATLAVSGGSTPKPLFEQLSQRPIDWASVTVTQVDERWVNEENKDSNARLIREHLLQKFAAAANFVSMKTSAGSPFEAEEEAAEKLSAFAETIDVVVLGMGGDGHTASFFPAADTLGSALDPQGENLCIAVRPPDAPYDRMTLSLAALLRSRCMYLHITGESKWKVLERAAEPGDVEELPIRSVLLGSRRPLQIYFASRN